MSRQIRLEIAHDQRHGREGTWVRHEQPTILHSPVSMGCHQHSESDDSDRRTEDDEPVSMFHPIRSVCSGHCENPSYHGDRNGTQLCLNRGVVPSLNDCGSEVGEPICCNTLNKLDGTL
jgi:hypothetical protein